MNESGSGSEKRDDSAVIMVDCDIGEPAILKDISMQIESGTLTMVAGPIGSGKSTLLRALLKEVPLAKGILRTAFSRTAYCSQQSWLINGTIKENIVGPEKSESSEGTIWYQRVVIACGLEADMKCFPRGDQTKIGSGGLRLSGGQRQRIVRYHKCSSYWTMSFPASTQPPVIESSMAY